MLSLWVASLGIDRISISGGYTSFIFTPFLLLSLIIISINVLKILAGFNTKFILPRSSSLLFSTLCILIILVMVSVLCSHDIHLSLRRFILLLMQIIFSFIIIRNHLLVISIYCFPNFFYSCIFQSGTYRYFRSPSIFRRRK